MMNQLQRIRAWVVQRIRNLIGYEGATSGRRGTNWHAPTMSPDDVALWSLQALRDRSRHMMRNHWAAARAADVLATHVVGAGILPSCRESEEYSAFLRLLSRPQAQIGVQKGQSLGALQRLVFRTVFESGMALVVRQARTRRQMRERGLLLPFQVAVLEPEYLDTMKDGQLENGNRILHGIELDSTDWPVAYHLYSEHPSSSLRVSRRPSVRVPAEDVSVVLWQKRPGQMIGVPWLHAVLVKLKDFDDYEDAQLLRQKIAALFVAFIKNMNGDAPSSTDDLELAPGRLQWLGAGEEVDFASPPDVGGFGEFTAVTLRAIAAGIGLTYEDLSADYSQVNFSSARMGSLVARQLTTVWQNEMMIGVLCQDLERWFAEGADLIGIDPCDAQWTPPARELIDPSREVGAIERKIAAGLTSRQSEVRKLGRDVEDVDAERAQDRERESRMGLGAPDATDAEDEQAADEMAARIADRLLLPD